jgi:hypothetical protein
MGAGGVVEIVMSGSGCRCGSWRGFPRIERVFSTRVVCAGEEVGRLGCISKHGPGCAPDLLVLRYRKDGFSKSCMVRIAAPDADWRGFSTFPVRTTTTTGLNKRYILGFKSTIRAVEFGRRNRFSSGCKVFTEGTTFPT